MDAKDRSRPTRIGGSAASPTYTPSSTLQGPSPQLAALLRWVNMFEGFAARRGVGGDASTSSARRMPSDIALTARHVLNELKKDLSFAWLHQFITTHIWEASSSDDPVAGGGLSAPGSTVSLHGTQRGETSTTAPGLSPFPGLLSNKSTSAFSALQPLPISSSLCYCVLSTIAPYVPPVEIYTVVSLLERIEHARKVVSGCHSSLKGSQGTTAGGTTGAQATHHGGSSAFPSAPATPASQAQRDMSITFTNDPSSGSSSDLDEDGLAHHHHHHTHQLQDANADIAFTDLGWTILSWMGRRCGSVEDVVTLCKPFISEAAMALLNFQTMCALDDFRSVAACCECAATAANPSVTAPQRGHTTSSTPQAAVWGPHASHFHNSVDLGDHLAEALTNWISDRLVVRAMSTFHGDTTAAENNTGNNNNTNISPKIPTAAVTPGLVGERSDFGESLQSPLLEAITPMRPVSHGANECVVMGDWAASPQRVPTSLAEAADNSKFFDYAVPDQLYVDGDVAPMSGDDKKSRLKEEEGGDGGDKYMRDANKAVDIATVFLCIIFRSHVPHSTRIAELARDTQDELTGGGGGHHCRVLDVVLTTVLRVASISDVGKFTDVPLLRQDLAQHFEFPATIAPHEALRSPSSGRRELSPAAASGLLDKKYSNSSIDEVFLQTFTVRNTSIVVEMLQTPRNFSLFTPPAGAHRSAMSPDLIIPEGNNSLTRPDDVPCVPAVSSPIRLEPATSRAALAADRYRTTSTAELDADVDESSARRSRTSTEVGVGDPVSQGHSPTSQTGPKRRRRQETRSVSSGGAVGDFSDESDDDGDAERERRRQQNGAATCACCSVM